VKEVSSAQEREEKRKRVGDEEEAASRYREDGDTAMAEKLAGREEEREERVAEAEECEREKLTVCMYGRFASVVMT
jgi:hypothetical protein